MAITVLDMFEKAVANNSEKIAFGDIEQEMSYGELYNKSKAVGSSLAQNSFVNKPIAIFMKRSVNTAIAMLGTLYSGNFYVILDSESPVERLNKILATLKPSVIIYDEQNKDNLRKIVSDSSMCLFTDLQKSNIDDNKLKVIKDSLLVTDPAYSIFTSGSTGFPKGVLISHSNLLNYIDWFTSSMGINNRTVFGAQTPLYFSMSVSDFYGTIVSGATYHIIPKQYFTFPAKLVDFMNKRKVNTLYWVPTALGIVAKFDLFKYAKLKYISKILFAGEIMPIKYLNYWKSYIPSAMYANLFGPTESTDICTFYIVDRDFNESETLPIGNACKGVRTYIIDDNGNEAKGSSEGELYIAGPFIAMGYYNNKKITNERFVQNPLHNLYPDIVYRTGDIVKSNSYGELEYLGRKDFQIKLNGYRIETGEIIACFASLDTVGLLECLVNKDEKLVLIYEGESCYEQKMRSIAKEKLTSYMRPEIYKAIDCFPKNANGKIDRNQLLELID